MTRKLFDWIWALWIFYLTNHKPEDILDGDYRMKVPRFGTPRRMEILCHFHGMEIGPAPIEWYKREEYYQNGDFPFDYWTKPFIKEYAPKKLKIFTP